MPNKEQDVQLQEQEVKLTEELVRNTLLLELIGLNKLLKTVSLNQALSGQKNK